MLRQILALLVVCFVTAVWAADPLAISGVTIAAPADPSAAAKYGKVELVVALTGGTFTSVYDPRPSAGGLDLGATFTGPDASQWNVYGYYDGASWRVRFAPTVTGNWTFSVSAQDSSGTATRAGGAFTCVASAAAGFARIDGNNLRCSEGTVLYAIGANNGWQYDVEQPVFATLAAQGINLMSFWMNSPWITPNDTQPRAPIENVTQGVGVYNQPACAYLDSVVADAEAAGIYLLPTIWSHGNLRMTGTHSWGTGWWDNLAYTSICTPTDFFLTTSGSSDTTQWVYQKNFYRYVLARWGYSRAVVAWVSLSEIEGTTGYAGTGGSANPAQATAWCGAISDYFAANDPYRVLAGKYPAAVSKTDESSSDAATWSNNCNLAAVDSYKQKTDNLAIADLIASQTADMRGTGRPAFHSEFGSGLKTQQPVHLHNGTWAGVSAGACMTPLLWCDGGSYPMLTDPDVGTPLQNNLSFLSQFTGGIDYIGASGYTAATVTVSPATSRGWGMRLGDRGFAWVQNKTGTMGGQTVAVSTLAAGRYQVTWYDPWSSAAGQTLPSGLVVVGGNGVLNLTVPTLAQNDIAVKFVLGPNSTAFGTTKMSDSYKDNPVTTGKGANKTTDFFPATTVNITTTISLGKSFDFSAIGATTPFSLDVGNYSFGAALDDADKFNLAAGLAIFVLTVDVTDKASDTKTVATGRLTLKWSKKNRGLTIKVAQKVPAKLVSLGAEPAVTILSYPQDFDGPINELVDVTVTFADVTVNMEGSMVGSQKTVTKADGTELINAHAKCTRTHMLR